MSIAVTTFVVVYESLSNNFNFKQTLFGLYSMKNSFDDVFVSALSCVVFIGNVVVTIVIGGGVQRHPPLNI